jgi:hypothetical protein
MNNGICQVTIEGKKVPLRFGIPANREFFTALEDQPGILIESQLNEVGIAMLLYCGYRNACLVNDQIEELKKGAFVAYVDEATVNAELNNEMGAAVQCYMDSIYTAKYTEQIQDTVEDLKKKHRSTGTELRSSAMPRSNSHARNIKAVPSSSLRPGKKPMKKSKVKK